jgi:hypothetical protein
MSDRDPASVAALARMEDANVEELSIPAEVITPSEEVKETETKQPADAVAAGDGRMPGF